MLTITCTGFVIYFIVSIVAIILKRKVPLLKKIISARKFKLFFKIWQDNVKKQILPYIPTPLLNSATKILKFIKKLRQQLSPATAQKEKRPLTKRGLFCLRSAVRQAVPYAPKREASGVRQTATKPAKTQRPKSSQTTAAPFSFILKIDRKT